MVSILCYIMGKSTKERKTGVMLIFLTVFMTIFVAEMGDKTQLLLVAMAGKYKIPHILTGTWLATVVLNLMAVGVGAALSNYLDMRIIKCVAGAAFFWFAYAALKSDTGEEEHKEMGHHLGPVLAIFGSFFIGELGDKTQLSAITLAANYTDHSLINAAHVFLGCTLGLILADLIGLVAGVFLKSKIPSGILNILSFFIFAIFGVLSIREAMGLIFGVGSSEALAVCIIITAAFALLCGIVICTKKKNRGKYRK